MPNRSAPWGHPAYHHEHTFMILRDTTSLKIEGVSQCMITRQEAQVKFNEYRQNSMITPWILHWWLQNERMIRGATIINCHFQSGETTCQQLSERLPDNSASFAAEATAITLAQSYYWHMGLIHHRVVVNFESMSCLQAIDSEDTENPFIRHIIYLKLLWLVIGKGICFCFCWIPSQCGIEGNERVDQLAKETTDYNIEPLAMCLLCKFEATGQLLYTWVGSNQVGCGCTWQRSISIETSPRAAKEISAPTKSHTQSRGSPATCHYCGQTLTIDHTFLGSAVWQESRNEYYTAGTWNTLFETFLRLA